MKFVNFSFTLLKFWHGRVVKCGRVSFIPDLAHFGRFGGLSRKSGPTDRPATEMPGNGKSCKNNFLYSLACKGSTNCRRWQNDKIL